MNIAAVSGTELLLFLPASFPASSVLRISVLTTHWKKAGSLDHPKKKKEEQLVL
jgi:hypothetical protein